MTKSEEMGTGGKNLIIVRMLTYITKSDWFETHLPIKMRSTIIAVTAAEILLESVRIETGVTYPFAVKSVFADFGLIWLSSISWFF